jgi:hypothetical protein
MKARASILFFLAWLAAPIAAAPCAAAGLAAGPMAGHGDATSTLIWLQGDAPAQARIEFWPEGVLARKRVSAPGR